VFGRPLERSLWEARVEATLALLTSDARPLPSAGAVVHDGATQRRVEGCRNARTVIERWTLRTPVGARSGEGGVLTVTNLAGPLTIEFDDGEERIERASSCVLPASLGTVTLRPEPGRDGDVVLCFEPAPCAPACVLDGRSVCMVLSTGRA